MGKSDNKQTKKRAHRATNDESKHTNNKPSFDATTFEATDNDGGLRHSQWHDHFRQLCEYKAKFGHCRVPTLYSDNPKLGKWVANQRYKFKLHQEGKPSSMTAERIQELGSVGFQWGTNKTDLRSSWNERFKQLREFKVQFGHCLVPQQYAANPKLGKWVMTQRSHYRSQQEGKPSSMTAERIQELENVDFEWEVRAHNGSWNERFDQLREFKVQFGHCRVPNRYSINLKLGKWVMKQRTNYRLQQEGKPSPMTAERIQELESVDFKRDIRAHIVSWNERFDQLREFKVQFGHCRVPNRYSDNPKLGKWVVNQRTNYRLQQEGKPSHMTAERIQELESVDFEWEVRAHIVSWNERFEELREFKVQFGHCRVPNRYSINLKLGKWVMRQRTNYRLQQEGKASPMTAERIQELVNVGIKWVTRNTDCANSR